MIEQNEEVVEETTDSVEETTEDNTEQPIEEVVEEIDESKFDSAGNDEVAKVNLDMPPQPKEEEEGITKVNVDEKPTEEITNEEVPVIEEITVEDLKDKEVLEEKVEEAVEETVATGKPLPENIQKLVDFMDETGGDINDYVRLNRDVKEMDDSDVLDEYYQMSKPHLTAEERNFLLEDTFGVDEEVDDDKTIRKKKIALKEQVAEAKAYLDGQKSKYYEEIKAGSKLTPEQQEAINFYHKYNEDSENQKKITQKSKRTFLNKTDSFFGQNFKGFEYNVGDKRYRFNVKDVDKVKTTQSDLNNFVNKFVGEDNVTIEDAAGYHKSLFTAMNPDAIAKHFYEQGKADAIKGQIARDKNINVEPRKTHGEVNVGGIKVRALGESSSEMKNRSFKIRKRK
tara:strand:+ start:3938 stop:5128 length:1191 start_codon:yes stop_codon:yes gene_type:complete